MQPAMPRTYRPPLSWRFARLLQGLFFSGVGLLSAYLLYIALPELAAEIPWWARIGIPVALLAIGSALLIFGRGMRITLDPDRIEVHRGSETRVLSRQEILGYRETRTGRRRRQTFLTLVPRDASRKPIRLSPLIKLDDYFWQWIRSFDNLDDKDVAQTVESIYANPEFGHTQEEREGALKAARRIARTCNIAAALLVLWAFLLPVPYVLAVLVLATLPWAALFVALRSRKLIRVDEYGKSGYPSLLLCMLLAPLALAARAMDFESLDWFRMVPISAVIGLVLFAAVLLTRAGRPAKPGGAAILFLFAAIYGFGAGFEANVLLDQSTPEVQTVEVYNKREKGFRQARRSFYRRYYLEFPPWGAVQRANSVVVSRATYDRTQPGDQVCVAIRPGALKVPWYRVEPCQ